MSSNTGVEKDTKLPATAVEINAFWAWLVTLPNVKFEVRDRNVHSLLMRNPGPGEMFDYQGLLEDQEVREKNPDGAIDICRAQPDKLYLTIFNLDRAKAALQRHSLVSVPA